MHDFCQNETNNDRWNPTKYKAKLDGKQDLSSIELFAVWPQWMFASLQ